MKKYFVFLMCLSLLLFAPAMGHCQPEEEDEEPVQTRPNPMDSTIKTGQVMSPETGAGGTMMPIDPYGTTAEGGTTMPIDPYGTTAEGETMMPPDPLGTTAKGGTMMPIDPLGSTTAVETEIVSDEVETEIVSDDGSHGDAMMPIDPLDTTAKGGTMMPIDPLDTTAKGGTMMPPDPPENQVGWDPTDQISDDGQHGDAEVAIDDIQGPGGRITREHMERQHRMMERERPGMERGQATRERAVTRDMPAGRK